MWLLRGYTWVASRQLLDETGRQSQISAVGQAPPSLIGTARMRIGSFNQAWLDEGQDRAAEMPGVGSGAGCPRLSPQLCAHKLRFRLCQARAQ